MDPQACLLEMLAAVYRGDADESSERLCDLLGWIGKGGFVPDLKTALESLREAGV
jgi:parvulin-like peptidyl-prolyl isomerase